jgi:hypothetical protein
MAKDKGKKDKGEKAPEVKSKKSKKGTKPEVDDEEELDDLDPKGPSDGVKIAEMVDELLLVTPTAIRRDMKTSQGVSDAIVADIVVLDPKKPKKSVEHKDALIFQTVLVGTLREKVGVGRVAAKLVKGEARNGNSAPYLFEKSDEAKAAAKVWIAEHSPEL